MLGANIKKKIFPTAIRSLFVTKHRETCSHRADCGQIFDIIPGRVEMFLNLRILCTPLIIFALSLLGWLSLAPTTGFAIEKAPTHFRQTVEGAFFLPSEYGQVIYQTNPDSPKQIYVIGQSHRSAITGKDNQDIVKVQAEIFRIGEWLIQQKNVGMLLPEGFFQSLSSSEVFYPRKIVRENVDLNSQTLQEQLSGAEFVNADMLLNANYNIPLGQVENEGLYRNIRQLLGQATRENNFSVLSRIHGLQGKRTAVMLQNIPGTVDAALAQGRISHPRAIFTIGLGHIGEIIDFLQQGFLPHPDNSEISTGANRTEVGLKLLDQGYGVTVIIPKTLAENEQMLRLARLETR